MFLNIMILCILIFLSCTKFQQLLHLQLKCKNSKLSDIIMIFCTEAEDINSAFKPVFIYVITALSGIYYGLKQLFSFYVKNSEFDRTIKGFFHQQDNIITGNEQIHIFEGIVCDRLMIAVDIGGDQGWPESQN